MTKRVPTAVFTIAAIGLCAVAALDTYPARGGQSDIDGARDMSTWPMTGGSPAEQHFSPLAQIDGSTVGKLGLVYSVELDTSRGQEASPIVVGGVLYTTTAWSKVLAVDAVSGRILWEYDPHVPGPTGYKACCDVVNRGAAYYQGKVYSATLDGRLIALDAKSGRLVWSVITLDQSKPYTITGAPRVAKGKIVIGNGGAEFGVRGYVTAYDAQSGRKVWRFYLVPGNPHSAPDGEISDEPLKRLALPTWYGHWWDYGGGGTAWDAIVYDPELNQIYIGTGNGSPWNRRIRSDGKGDNLFLSSIVAVDPDTGRYIWHYQETPGESWDFTATQPIIQTHLQIEGHDRQVLMQAPKNGFFYVLDRRTGQLLSAKNIVKTTWATSVDMETGRPVETQNARYLKPEVAMPGSPGAHSWEAMAYSPRTGLVYIPTQTIPYLYVDDGQFTFRPGEWNLGVRFDAVPPPSTDAAIEAVRNGLKGSLLAWDPVKQAPVWSVPYATPVNGGVLATASDLVFQGLADGAFVAYDATTGHEVWRYKTGNGIVAAPIAFEANGEEYIAVMSGYGGAMALALPDVYGSRARMNGRLLVFKLGGDAKLPAIPAIDAPAPTSETWPAGYREAGQALYATHCAGCHAVGVLSWNVVPDLRRSAALSNKQAWHAVLIDGVLQAQGMVSFRNKLSGEDAEKIRAYVNDRALALMPSQTK